MPDSSSRTAPRTTSSRPTFVDLFAGCGGLSLGLMQAGWEGVFAVERDPMAFSTLSSNLIASNNPTGSTYQWPRWLPKQAHEIGEFLSKYEQNLSGLRHKVDLIAGGPPCQGFSMAGRRLEDDPRNQLFTYYVQIVNLIQPKFLVLENVRGISVRFENGRGERRPPTQDQETPETQQVALENGTSEETRRAYSEIIRERLENLSPGYQIFADVIKASQYGVPQRRPRFIMFGIRKDLWQRIERRLGDQSNPLDLMETLRKEFLTTKGLDTNVPVTCGEAIGDFTNLDRRASSDSKGFRELVYKEPERLTSFAKLMRVGMNGKSLNSLRLANHKDTTESRWRRMLNDDMIPKGVQVSREHRRRYGIESKQCLVILDKNQMSHTLTTLPDDLLHYEEPRILTVREYARLQSFPDWFEFHGKYTTGGERRKREAPRYTQVGNAVPPLLGEMIGRVMLHLRRALRGRPNKRK